VSELSDLAKGREEGETVALSSWREGEEQGEEQNMAVTPAEAPRENHMPAGHDTKGGETMGGQTKTSTSPNEIKKAVKKAVEPAGTCLDIGAIRERLALSKGREYWRSLEEVASTPEFQAFVEKEFPPSALERTGSVSRRTFLRLMGASLALAGLTACIQRPRELEPLVPYVKKPEEIIPGEPLYFASTLTLGGYAMGVLVESNMGRPTKVDGNPDHPASLGATDPIMQASILTLYDPDRSQTVLHRGEPNLWEDFLLTVEAALADFGDGAGLRILTETITSPSLATQLERLLEKYPGARWHQYEAVNDDNAVAGAELAFGEAVDAVYNFEEADVILSLDDDFLGRGPGKLRYTRDFTDRRRVALDETVNMNRLYAVESSPGLTGTMAEHHYSLRPGQIEGVARVLAQELGLPAGTGADLPEAVTAWLGPLAQDLRANAGRSLVTAGAEQPPIVHALAHAMNNVLGNVGTTVSYIGPVAANPVNQTESLRELTRAMQAGDVEALFILGGNPAFTAPADIDFAGQLAKVAFKVHLGLYLDETAVLCDWHIPMTHELESWGDARAFDGTLSMIQPLIAPLYGGHTVYEVLAALLGDISSSNYDLVRGYWQEQVAADDFESFWRKAVHDGVVEGSGFPPRAVSLRAEVLSESPSTTPGGGLDIVFRPDPYIWDSRFANNAWLQELPRPLTKLTWDNAALISPATAERLGLDIGDVVELRYEGRAALAPIFILPGHPPDTVTAPFGFGRTQTGRVGMGVGFNAYALRTSAAPWFGSGLDIVKVGGRYPLATTQDHHAIHTIKEIGEESAERHLVRQGTVGEYRENPDFVHELEHRPEGSLYPGYLYTSYAWGMTIDLSTCTGCHACVVACQAENNIPTVGKDEVLRGREMHWIRVDRYYQGDIDHPDAVHQPVTCMHCENAPCEVVCPVGATVHSTEGLNDMVYNRCVGTRYCSNNCPYKVRRFNFFFYARLEEEALKLLLNPEVSVRSRGVMEKCTYCVQRINSARIEAELEDRRIRDGEVTPACAAACPGRAIVFGDINDPDSLVARLKSSPLNYGLLMELNTLPRTSYLARLNNPNPELEGA
jgi:molybdopterin-containing oxidoreductase family iron-sulfur binding subunit